MKKTYVACVDSTGVATMLCTVSFFLMLEILNGVCLCFFVISAQQPIDTC